MKVLKKTMFPNEIFSDIEKKDGIIALILFLFIFIDMFLNLFRGFLWPRLVVGFGKTVGTVLSGIFFGMAHLPIDIVFNNKTVFETFILGNTSNLDIRGGIAITLFFIFIYTRNCNILLPSFIHGIQDMLSIL